SLPSLLGENLEMLGAIGVAVHAHEHFSALIHAIVFKNVTAYPRIALGQYLAVRIALNHPLDNFAGGGQRSILGRGKRCGRKEKQNDGQQNVMFHDQNSSTNFPRYSRQAELKNPSNRALARLF